MAVGSHESQEPQPIPMVATKLHTMSGLASDQLRAAIRAGHNESEGTTPNDVVTRAGYVRWATPLRYLGDAYVEKGFKRERPGGFEVLRSPDDSFDVAIAPGTYDTGLDGPGRMPSTRIERGPLTRQAVEGNRHQMSFDANVLALAGERLPATGGPVTWLLLHYFDRRADEIRLELSRPVEYLRTSKLDSPERGIVTCFDPRLILPPIALAATAEVAEEDDADAELDIPVSRRR